MKKVRLPVVVRKLRLNPFKICERWRSVLLQESIPSDIKSKNQKARLQVHHPLKSNTQLNKSNTY